MGRLKLRTFSIALVMVASTLGMALTFSDTLVSNSGQNFDDSDQIKQLRSNFGDQKANITGTKTQAKNVGIQTDFFFLKEIWTVITTVVGGVSATVNLIGSAATLTGLNIPDSVLGLASIIVVGVVFAVVSAARGWDV